MGLIPGSRRSPGEEWQPTPVFLPGKLHRKRSLTGCSPWGHSQTQLSDWAYTHHQKEQRWQVLARMWKEEEPLCTAEGNGYWHSNYEKLYGVSSRTKKIELPHNPDITLLDICMKKMKHYFVELSALLCSLEHYS